MKLQVLILTGLVMLLGGCAGQARKNPNVMHLASDVAVVKYPELAKYWVPVSEHTPFTRYDRHPFPECVRIQYIIDSNGNVFNPKMINKKGNKNVYLMALSSLVHLHYRPAKTNPERIPVQTIMEWDFVSNQGKNAGKKVSCEPAKT